MRYKRILFIPLLMLVCFNAQGAAIGMSQDTARIGYGVGYSLLSLDDPNGADNRTTTYKPLKLIYTDWDKNGNRYWIEAYFQNAEFDASEQDVGQYVEQAGSRFLVQTNLNLHRMFKPWLGAGVDISGSRYIKRHTRDSDGFLTEQYPNRSKVALGLVFTLANQWRLDDDWELGAGFEHLFTDPNALNETSFSIFTLYRYR